MSNTDRLFVAKMLVYLSNYLLKINNPDFPLYSKDVCLPAQLQCAMAAEAVAAREARAKVSLKI